MLIAYAGREMNWLVGRKSRYILNQRAAATAAEPAVQA